jgi:predicted glycoside hydrolase/deacetylase ChbG (UPF0249 family)
VSPAPDVVHLIVNADDFGWDDETTDATIALLESGAATSATIMTGRPATQRALTFAKAAGTRFSFGLHFNIVDGQAPLSAPSPSLVDRSGRFRSSHRQRLAALAGRLDPIDIARECGAQLDVLAEAGVTVSHLDSHGHLHKFPLVAGAVRPILAERGIRFIRRPQNFYFRRAPLDFLDRYCTWRFPAIATTDYFVAGRPGDGAWVSRLPPGITEIAVHPGWRDDWRRAETQALLDARAAIEGGATVMSYNDLVAAR